MARSWDEILHDPRIDDSGDYDYLAEELPQDRCYWLKGKTRCESCGKYHWRTLRSTHYFYCYDGWDSMSYDECWNCLFKAWLKRIKRKIVRRTKR